MLVNNLAVVVPMWNLTGDDQKLRETIWRQVSGLLLTQLGKRYSRFQPAARAWGQTVDRPFGVALGRSDPALFLYLYTQAKARQEEAIHFHMEKFLDGVDIHSTSVHENIILCSVNTRDDCDATRPHMLWHLAMMGGELLPDCGLYFMEEKKPFADNALEEKVLSRLDRYALCIVKLILEDGDEH